MAFSLLPSSPGSFSFSASNQPQTHCGCLFVLIPRHLQIRNDPVSPLRFVLLICDGCSLLFSPPKGLLSLCPSLLLLKCVISPSHHHQASKTAHRYTFFLNFWLDSDESLQKREGGNNYKKKIGGGQNNRKRKRDQRRENPSKCIHVSCR